MAEYEDIPPGTDLINTIRAEKSPFHLWACEAIDNSLDAESSRVELSMTSDHLDCKDDGVGVTTKHALNIVRIASHGELATTRLGRFGVGIKYKSIQHGRSLYVQSVSMDGKLRRTADWEHMLRIGRWQYSTAAFTPVAIGTPTGTVVSVRGLIRSPSKSDIDKTRTEIARRYYPAMEAAKVILLNGDAVAPIAWPELEYEIDEVLEFPEGRSARVHGGKLKHPDKSKLRQVDVCVAFRIIKPESAVGCNGYGGIRSMYARVDLCGDWLLTKFKDDIAEDPYYEDLQVAVENVLRPILERCTSESMSLREKTLENLLNEMISEERRMSRPESKQKLDRVGVKRGEKKGRKLEKSIPSSSGPTQKKSMPRGIMIEFAAGLNDEHGLGRALIEKSSTRIQLAKDNRDISILMNTRDQQIAKIGLFCIASLIYEASKTQLDIEPIGRRAWRLARQDDSAISEVAA